MGAKPKARGLADRGDQAIVPFIPGSLANGLPWALKSISPCACLCPMQFLSQQFSTPLQCLRAVAEQEQAGTNLEVGS